MGQAAFFPRGHNSPLRSLHKNTKYAGRENTQQITNYYMCRASTVHQLNGKGSSEANFKNEFSVQILHTRGWVHHAIKAGVRNAGFDLKALAIVRPLNDIKWK